MKLRRRYRYRTDYLIRQAEREYWLERLGYMRRRLLLLFWRAAREVLRLLALTAGTSLFMCVAVPVMEFRPERTLIIAELLAVLAFGLWLGGRIYEPTWPPKAAVQRDKVPPQKKQK